MKKFFQISGVILTIGIILLVVGKLNDGDRGLSFFNWNVVQPHSWHDDDSENDDDDDEYSSGAEVTSAKLPKFSKIKLDIIRPDVRISVGKNYYVNVSGPKKRKVNASVKNGQLTLADHQNNSFVSYMGDSDEYTVEIFVPSMSAVQELIGESADGDLTLTKVAIPHVEVRLKEGDLTLNQVKSDYTKLTLVDGDLQATDSALKNSFVRSTDGDLILTNSQFKMTATLNDGDVSITSPNVLGNSTFSLASGEFKIIAAPKIGYDLYTDQESDLQFRGQYHYSGHFRKNASHQPLLKVICRDGDIDVQ